MANPPDLNYCKIVGNFKAFIADNADSDDLPDFVPMSGMGQIWPNVQTAKNTAVGYKSTYFNSPIPVTVDLDGDLSQGGRKYVMVLAESPTVNPSNFNYSIKLSLAALGESNFRDYGPFAFNVTPNGEIDITDVIPVTISNGTPIVQGPQGEPGDLIGVTNADWQGAVGLPEFPKTYLATLTGNVTSITLPTGLLAEQSGTLTLVTQQDAIGGRTNAWPTEILWPEGLEPQPTPGANTVSMFNLLWTGQNWLGLLGGKTFA
jgi:hypothetical protein